jgi:hypothetical protein
MVCRTEEACLYRESADDTNTQRRTGGDVEPRLVISTSSHTAWSVSLDGLSDTSLRGPGVLEIFRAAEYGEPQCEGAVTG